MTEREPETLVAAGGQDHLLEHSYDGIQEYDNPLPGWWVWIFLATIGFSFFYAVYYHLGTGLSIHDGYDLEAAAFFEMQAKQLEGVEVTEALLYKQSLNKDLVAGVKKRFQAKCATCHNQEAQGDACPNLTDDYWLHGGDLLQIYTTIKNGVPGTEMKSWLTELGPAGVLNMAAFVGSLRGTNHPGGKKAEGKKYVIRIPEMIGSSGPAGGETKKKG